MYVVGEHIISKFSGSFFDFVDERIFKPLNMSSTYYSPAAAFATGRATENWTKDGHRIPWWFTEQDHELVSGPGGVIASSEDLVSN